MTVHKAIVLSSSSSFEAEEEYVLTEHTSSSLPTPNVSIELLPSTYVLVPLPYENVVFTKLSTNFFAATSPRLLEFEETP